MTSIQDTIIYVLGGSQGMLERFSADLTPADYLHRPVHGANCAAWIIGHLVLSDRRVLEAMGETDLPALPDGFAARFGREADAPAANDFGDVSILLPLSRAHRDRLIAAVRKASLEKLNAPLPKPHPRFNSLGEMAAFMSVHVGQHCGHISTIRRSLGRTWIN